MIKTGHAFLLAVILPLAVCQTVRANRFDDWDGNGDGRLTRDELPERVRPGEEAAEQ